MALTKDIVIDRIEITEELVVQIRRALYILEDGIRVAGPVYQRRAYPKNDPDMANEPLRIRNIAMAAWA